VAFKNASQLPKVYYGLHMVAGLAQYPEIPGAPTILIEEPTLQNMDPTAQGKPVYVHHVDEVDLSKLENEIAGVWIRSFFNEADGAHWAEFTIQSDLGHEAISKGFVLSNSYIPKQQDGPGEYHGMRYNNAITAGEYEHLALTPRPRYQESIILTPEEFKAYNAKKLNERMALKNSKGVSTMAFTLFGKKKIENTADLEGAVVELPKSKKQVELSKLVNDADEKEVKEAKNEYAADLSHKVKLHDGKMCNVGELLEMHKTNSEAMEALKKENEEMKAKMPKEEGKEEGTEEHNSEDPAEDKEIAGKAKEIEDHEKAEMAEKEKKMNALSDLEKLYLAKGLEVPAKLQAAKKNSIEHFNALKNAQAEADKLEAEKIKNAQSKDKDGGEIKTTSDRAAEGKAKY
jgi:hypothetical protein